MIYNTRHPKFGGLFLATSSNSFTIYDASGPDKGRCIELNFNQLGGLLEIAKLVELRIEGKAPGNGPKVTDTSVGPAFLTSALPDDGRVRLHVVKPRAPKPDAPAIEFTIRPFTEAMEAKLAGDGLPKFPDIACPHQHEPGDGCGFTGAGIGLQCTEGRACGRYLHPGDPGHAELDDFYRAMRNAERQVEQIKFAGVDMVVTHAIEQTHSWADAAAQLDQLREQAETSGEAVVTAVQVETGVLVLLLTNDGDVWLAERTDPNRPYFGAYASPGGSIEPGETPHEAARRELREETGLDLAYPRLRYGVLTEHMYDDGRPFKMHWYYARLESHEIPQRTEPAKQGAWRKHGHQYLPAGVTPGTEAAITGARDLGLLDKSEEAPEHDDDDAWWRCYHIHVATSDSGAPIFYVRTATGIELSDGHPDQESAKTEADLIVRKTEAMRTLDDLAAQYSVECSLREAELYAALADDGDPKTPRTNLVLAVLDAIPSDPKEPRFSWTIGRNSRSSTFLLRVKKNSSTSALMPVLQRIGLTVGADNGCIYVDENEHTLTALFVWNGASEQ